MLVRNCQELQTVRVLLDRLYPNRAGLSLRELAGAGDVTGMSTNHFIGFLECNEAMKSFRFAYAFFVFYLVKIVNTVFCTFNFKFHNKDLICA